LKDSIRENMHGLLESTFVQYANLRSGVKEFARLGYIELVDARIKIPNGLPAFLVRTIKRAKPPIWIPGPNYPDDPREIYDLMQPSMRGDEIVWQHSPSKRCSTWRNPAHFNLSIDVKVGKTPCHSRRSSQGSSSAGRHRFQKKGHSDHSVLTAPGRPWKFLPGQTRSQ